MKKLQEGALKADNTPYTAEEIKQNNEFVELVETTAKEAISGMISKEEADKSIADAVKTATEPIQKELTELYEKTLKMGANIQKGKMNGNSQTPKQQLKEAIVENKEAIKSILNSEVTGKELVLKADTTRASIGDSTSATLINGIGQIGVKRRGLYDVASKLPLNESNNQGIIRYIDWDEATTVRAAAMVAETGTFPESTAKFKQYTLPLQKIGDTLPVTEEFFEDEALAAAELDMFLNVNVNQVIDDQIVNGNGTGSNLKGLKSSVSEYTVPSAGITDANIYDLIHKMKSYITSNYGSKYAPNFAAMNSNVIDQLMLKKDANNNYMFPAGHPIYSMIVQDDNMDDNELVVGDGRFMRIYEKTGVILSRGEPNAQFLEDMKTIKARKRMLFLIRTADKTGFLKCTDIATALDTLNAVVTP